MLTNIGIVIDRSASMHGMEEAVSVGLSKFTEEQSKVEGDAELTLYQFDSEFEKVYRRKKLEASASFELKPRGMTALYDAVGRAIVDMEQDNELRGKIDQPDQNVLVVITDGGENASREYTHASMTELIGKKTEDGWQVVFLSSEPDVITQAHNTFYQHTNFDDDHIHGSVATFLQTAKGYGNMFSNLSSNMSNYRTVQSVKFNSKK